MNESVGVWKRERESVNTCTLTCACTPIDREKIDSQRLLNCSQTFAYEWTLSSSLVNETICGRTMYGEWICFIPIFSIPLFPLLLFYKFAKDALFGVWRVRRGNENIFKSGAAGNWWRFRTSQWQKLSGNATQWWVCALRGVICNVLCYFLPLEPIVHRDKSGECRCIEHMCRTALIYSRVR